MAVVSNGNGQQYSRLPRGDLGERCITVWNHEISVSICSAGVGAGDRGDGVGADGDAICDPRTGGDRASAGRAWSG